MISVLFPVFDRFPFLLPSAPLESKTVKSEPEEIETDERYRREDESLETRDTPRERGEQEDASEDGLEEGYDDEEEEEGLEEDDEEEREGMEAADEGDSLSEPQDLSLVDYSRRYDRGSPSAAQAAGVPLDQMGAESAPWANNNKPDVVEVAVAGRGRWRSLRKPGVVVGMRLGDAQEDIVDLDSFTNQHFRAKALRAAAAATQVKSRTLQRKVEREIGPVFGLRMELDVGVGMVGLEPVESDFDLDMPQRRQPHQQPQRVWLQKRELADAYVADPMDQWYVEKPRGRWISVLNIGFSRLDISLCVILYFLSSLCLMAMYLFFKTRLRIRRVKVSNP